MERDKYLALELSEMEDNIQDLLYLQAAEYDRERGLLREFSQPLKIGKRVFSHKIKFKNRRNHHRFAKRHPNDALPF